MPSLFATEYCQLQVPQKVRHGLLHQWGLAACPRELTTLSMCVAAGPVQCWLLPSPRERKKGALRVIVSEVQLAPQCPSPWHANLQRRVTRPSARGKVPVMRKSPSGGASHNQSPYHPAKLWDSWDLLRDTPPRDPCHRLCPCLTKTRYVSLIPSLDGLPDRRIAQEGGSGFGSSPAPCSTSGQSCIFCSNSILNQHHASKNKLRAENRHAVLLDLPER